MRKTYRYRLYPSKAQAIFLDGQLREACGLYNAGLQERRDAYRMCGKSLTYYDQANQLKEIRAEGWLDLANFSCCQDVLRRLDKTFKAFFRRVKNGEKAGFPRFRSHRRFDSITFPSYGDGCKVLPSGKLKIQGAGHLKVKWHRPVEGTIKTVTIKRAAGKWYVCFSVECEAQPLPLSDQAVGLDVGLTTFAVLDDGQEIENPRLYRQAQAQLRRAQRKVARRKKGGKGRRKAVVLLQKASAHVTNKRLDFHHKESRKLVERYGLIAVEDLNIKGLAAGMLAKSVHDVGWGSFLQLVATKAECAGRLLIKVNPRGTSQRCSACGTTVHKELKDRWHDCPSCGLSIGRDHNSAKEILRLGLSLAGVTWRGASGVPAEAVVDAGRPEAVCFS